MKANRKRKILFTLMILGLFLAMVAVVGEGTLRKTTVTVDIAAAQAKYRTYQDRAGRSQEGRHPDTLKKHKITFNQLGLRDDRLNRDFRKKNGFRIAILGDSFVENMGLSWEEGFVAQLNQEFSGFPCPVEVINLGIGGLGTFGEVKLARETLGAVQPDLVLWLWFNNDLWETMREQKQGGISEWSFLGRSYLVHFLVQRVQIFKDAHGISKKQNYKYRMLYLPFFTGGEIDQDVARALTATGDLFLEFKKFCASLKSKLAVVTVPNGISFSELTNRENYAQIFYQVARVKEDFRPGLAYARIAQLAIDRDIPVYPRLFLDFKKALVGKEMLHPETRQQLYFIGDNHWNENGCKVSAHAVGRWLKESKLLNVACE